VEPKIIYADNDFLAVSKPAGLLVHETRRGKRGRENNEPTLVDWLLPRYPEIRNVGDNPAARPGIVHRLDRDTSGVMLVARNQAYFNYLKSLFQSRQVDKTYLAVVFGAPRKKSGKITGSIGIKSGTTKRSIYSEKDAKPAETEYRVLKIFEREGERYSLLEVKPKTGRTHQIRVHLASLGNPVVGDPLYGPKTLNLKAKSSRLMLHALSLEFNLGGKRRIKIEAEPPAEFRKFVPE
jgi:23S rRNA pseudouridine1911/1915/1917 synthase